MSFLTKIFGDPNQKEVDALMPLVEKINALEPVYREKTDADLQNQTVVFREALKQGKSLDDLLPDAFACVREASRRVLGMRHFDVQLIGGIFLHRGHVVEMKTGEGKTLVATLPTYLNALAEKGVHVVTVNDYLARRDAEWMGKLYDFLGMSVSCVQNQTISFLYDKTIQTEMSSSGEEKNNEPAEDHEASGTEVAPKVSVEMRNLRRISRREAYVADITYGTNNEFGFDYLRDNMVSEQGQKVQRGHYFSIVDEVDSILIDEARTPLIISAPAEESTDQYYRFSQLIRNLVKDTDFNIDEKMRAATLTDAGIAKMEGLLNMENIYVEGGLRTVHHLEQALKAEALFKKDRDYVVKDGEVIIVDEFTGRLMYGRRYSEGLHQAIEAKEGVEIKRESRTMATITFQNYFRMYEKLSGMTGTAMTEAEEFSKIYKLETVAIPTNRNVIRKDQNDRIYKTEEAKFRAVIDEIKSRHAQGQPVLVGTISIEKNEQLSELLNMDGIPHQILNAKQHEKEAAIIAQAGRLGAVTIATNMAGRGVDIILGGNPTDTAEAEKVKTAGGLHVIGTERHEARRIDNQLRGRAGRQGDPGSSQFYVSTDDDLMRVFGSDRIRKVMDTLKIPEDMPIENTFISKSLESAQRRVEGHNFDIRKHLVDYDDVMNKQREIIYKKRDEVLSLWEKEKETSASDALVSSNEEKSLEDVVWQMIEDEITNVVTFHTADTNIKEWNLKEIAETMRTIFSLTPEKEKEFLALAEQKNKPIDSVREEMMKFLIECAETSYTELESSLTALTSDKLAMRRAEKELVLRSIDNLWIEHLESMQHLRTGIGLRGYGQNDPLVEYKRESFRMFQKLLADINAEVVYAIYKIGDVSHIGPSFIEQAKKILSAPAKEMQNALKPFSDAVSAITEVFTSEKAKDADGNKIGRNDPCHCGSGKKYKKCHGV